MTRAERFEIDFAFLGRTETLTTGEGGMLLTDDHAPVEYLMNQMIWDLFKSQEILDMV